MGELGVTGKLHKQEIMVREFNGVNIRFMDGEKVNLTELWKASGESSDKRPSQWLNESASAEFILAVIKSNNPKFKCSGEAHFNNKPYGKDANRDMEKWCRETANLANRAGLLETQRGRGGGTLFPKLLLILQGKILKLCWIPNNTGNST